MSMQASELYSDDACEVGVSIFISSSESCVSSECAAITLASNTYYLERSCAPDVYEHTEDFFDAKPYLHVALYAESDCSTYVESTAYAAEGKCEAAGIDGQRVIATLYTDGTASLRYFLDQACTLPSSSLYSISRNDISNHPCSNGRRYYASSSEGPAATGFHSPTIPDTSTGVSGLAIAGIVAGVVIVLLVVGVWLFKRRKRRHRVKRGDSRNTTQINVLSSDDYEEHESPDKLSNAMRFGSNHRHTKIWDDDIVVAARIPRDQVMVQQLLSRGGYGEVYIGRYQGRQVAVKMLLPEKKKEMSQVNAFLCEVKLMACLDHPRIVSFIGVAWDQLVDICVVSEYMSGGDLKAVLTEYENRDHPVGFDHMKVKIALHVATALTYLHSCTPPVIHRDLKSKNILLDESMNAKVTDFGISRERIDATMTGGVGTSFWMAPEVMMGERYDDKVDMFSFGVVLSELDSHVLPYASANRSDTNHSSGTRNLPSAAILQMVAAGVLRVEFSDASPQSIVDLGLACVSLDPKERPTAAKAMRKLQRILAEEV